MCVSLSGFAAPPIRPPIWLGLHRFRCSSSHACLRKWRERFVLSLRKLLMLFISAPRLGLFVRRYDGLTLMRMGVQRAHRNGMPFPTRTGSVNDIVRPLEAGVGLLHICQSH